ncbi:MAG TPA: beta-ketoacyl synthase N-terminal-like domain-containing protein, partial [Clostridia bacterium]
MYNNRVVITGIGVSLPEVSGKSDFWNSIMNKTYNFTVTREKVDNTEKYRYSGQLESVDLTGVPPIIIKQADIATQFALSTVLMALDDANIKPDDAVVKDIGFFFGTELGGLKFAEIEYSKYVEKGYRYISPYLSIGMFYSAPIGQLSIILGAKGFSKTYCSGECSGSTAIGEAYRVIKDGLAKIIVSGGYEKSNTLSSNLIYHDKNLLACG